MATKTAIENGNEAAIRRRIPPSVRSPEPCRILGGNAMGAWTNFTRFLSDVRAEMRKVVTPSRKEVKATTTVVIIAVFIFGFFFFVVD